MRLVGKGDELLFFVVDQLKLTLCPMTSKWGCSDIVSNNRKTGVNIACLENRFETSCKMLDC